MYEASSRRRPQSSKFLTEVFKYKTESRSHSSRDMGPKTQSANTLDSKLVIAMTVELRRRHPEQYGIHVHSVLTIGRKETLGKGLEFILGLFWCD